MRATCFVALTFAALPLAAGPLCVNDQNRSMSMTMGNTSDRTQVTAYSRSALEHTGSHATCSGILRADAHLWIETHSTGCETWNSGGAIATDSEAGHTVDAERECTVYLCSTAYRTRGYHRFNGTQFATSFGNYTTGGECVGDGNGGGQQNGPCDCQTCGCSPLVLDLARDGFLFSSADEGVLFQIGPPGKLFWVGWPVSPDDVWLALDRNHSGAIEDASELFGTSTKLATGAWARHGFEALAEFDVNLDGQIDATDPVYGELWLWSDANRNGVSEPSELRTLTDASVVSLSTRYYSSRLTDPAGNFFALRSEARASPRPAILEMTDVFPDVESAP
jgi:hypothetical protein